MTRTLTLVRHGESTYNADNRFTGWIDPELSEHGVSEAHAVAAHLRDAGMTFDRAFSSALSRARQTARIILSDLEQATLPVTSELALDERHYGDMSGMNKDEARSRWGDAQVQQWRRSYLQAPPGGESLRDVAARVLAFYLQQMLPPVMREQTTLVVAHGNSLRALVMVLDGLSPETVSHLEIATGEVLVYELASDTTVSNKRTLEVIASRPELTG